MDIKLFKENGAFTLEGRPNYCKGGPAMVSVECDNYGCDEVILRKEAVSFLNSQALPQGMRVEEVVGPQTTIPIRVKKGESARVKRLDFPIDIVPQE